MVVSQFHRNQEVIITKFFKHYTAMDNLDLSEYFDLEYSETDSEYSSSGSKTESEDKDVYSNNVPPPIIMGTAE